MQLAVAPPFLVSKPVAGERAYYDLVDEDALWELLDGRLVMSPASYRHEQLFRFLLTLLSGWLDERGGATVLGSRYPMRLDPRWSPEPALVVITDQHRHRITEQRLDGPADLVVEITSDGDPALDERDKLPRYRAANIPEIWLISPQTTTVRCDQVDSAGSYRTERRTSGRLGSVVLPGFGIDVEWSGSSPCRRPWPACASCSRRSSTAHADCQRRARIDAREREGAGRATAPAPRAVPAR